MGTLNSGVYTNKLFPIENKHYKNMFNTIIYLLFLNFYGYHKLHIKQVCLYVCH